jgi:hypothetical protein
MGWNFPVHPILGALILTPLSNIFMGISLGWLYLCSRSIWMPTLAHAAINLTATLLFSEMIMQRDDLFLQLMFLAAWGGVAALCLISMNWKKPMLWQSAEESTRASPHAKSRRRFLWQAGVKPNGM